MAEADQAAAGIDRKAPVRGDPPGFDRLPALAGFGQAAVVDGHVLGHREAVVRFQPVDIADALHAGTAQGVVESVAHVGKQQWLPGAEFQFPLQQQRRGPVAPALDAR